MKYKTIIVRNDNVIIVRLYQADETCINDATIPNRDLGFLCFRDITKWLVSGMICSSLTDDKNSLHDLIYYIAEDLLDIDDILTLRVSITNTYKTLYDNNEEGEQFI
jgi:hypothetical protein